MVLVFRRRHLHGNFDISAMPALNEEGSKMDAFIGCRDISEAVVQTRDNQSILATDRSLVRKISDGCLPSLQHWSSHQSGLGRSRRVYLRRTCEDFPRARKNSLADKKQVELPGIGTNWRRKSNGKICVHDREALCTLARTKTGDTGECSLLCGNSSSGTGSESWTSGNGSTSPRRKIRVPTTVASSPSRQEPDCGPESVMHLSPHPPSFPRKVVTPRSLVSCNKKGGEDILGAEICRLEKHEEPEIRPETPAPRKSVHFELTLQNIQEHCLTEDSDDSDREYGGTSKRVFTSTEWTNRRCSLGNVIENRSSNNDAMAGGAVAVRRSSMPVDIHELRKRQGVQFINVREVPRECLQQLLSRRERGNGTEVASNESRQRKCLSWLQSLEQSG